MSPSSLVAALKRRNMEAQFWFYETGNVVAAITGAGGFQAFYKDLHTSFTAPDQTTWERVHTLTSSYPDATAALGICSVVIIGPALKSRFNAGAMINTIDAGIAAAAFGLATYSITQDTSAITIAATLFVLGSSFLRFAEKNPFFLKIGGIALAAGGAALTTFGAELATQPGIGLAVPSTTIGTGIYVSLASLLTYEGGIYETLGKQDDKAPLHGWAARLIHPHRGMLARAFNSLLDHPIQSFNKAAKNTALRFIPKHLRDTKPFATSMWARLPWRVASSVAAALSGNYTMAIVNLGWGCGDVCIGLEDYESKDETHPKITKECADIAEPAL